MDRADSLTNGPPVRRSWAQHVSYDLSRVAVRMAGVAVCGLRVHGRHHFPASGGGLVCANHQSVLDPVIVGLACDRRLNYLARDTLFTSPAFGWLIRWYDAIPIQREGLGLAGIKETLRRVRGGELVLIFPEGTRTADGDLQPLKTGFCMLARRAQVPIIPVGLDGPYQAWPRHRKWPRRTRMDVDVGLPLAPETYRDWTDQQLVDELAARLRACLERARRRRGGNGICVPHGAETPAGRVERPRRGSAPVGGGDKPCGS